MQLQQMSSQAPRNYLSTSPQLIVLIQCSEGKRAHVHNEQIQRMLGRFIATCSKEAAAGALDEVYLWSALEDTPAALRSAIAERVLLPLLRQCSLDAAEQFFAKRVSSIMSAVSEQQELRSEVAIRARMAAFNLIHVMFERLPTSKVYGERKWVASFSRGEVASFTAWWDREFTDYIFPSVTHALLVHISRRSYQRHLCAREPCGN
jgi:hypothetical protein